MLSLFLIFRHLFCRQVTHILLFLIISFFLFFRVSLGRKLFPKQGKIIHFLYLSLRIRVCGDVETNHNRPRASEVAMKFYMHCERSCDRVPRFTLYRHSLDRIRTRYHSYLANRNDFDHLRQICDRSQAYLHNINVA